MISSSLASTSHQPHHRSIQHKVNVQERLGKGTANPNLRLLIEQPHSQCGVSSAYGKSSADCTISTNLSSHFTNDSSASLKQQIQQQDLFHQQTPLSARYPSSLTTVTSPNIFHNQVSQPSRFFFDVFFYH